MGQMRRVVENFVQPVLPRLGVYAIIRKMYEGDGIPAAFGR
jgi:hypothetical protein